MHKSVPTETRYQLVSQSTFQSHKYQIKFQTEQRKKTQFSINLIGKASTLSSNSSKIAKKFALLIPKPPVRNKYIHQQLHQKATLGSDLPKQRSAQANPHNTVGTKDQKDQEIHDKGSKRRRFGAYAALGSSSSPGGGTRGGRWLAPSRGSRIPRCRSPSQESPLRSSHGDGGRR